MSTEELRRRAAQYRDLARDCSYPEGVNLLLMMADVHEESAIEHGPRAERLTADA
jgi:hypothetical protein